MRGALSLGSRAWVQLRLSMPRAPWNQFTGIHRGRTGAEAFAMPSCRAATCHVVSALPARRCLLAFESAPAGMARPFLALTLRRIPDAAGPRSAC